MDCFTGVAAATGLGAKEVFDYNRDNFLYDRRLRLKKELKLQEFRIEQGELWREDVRDLISLTEYKMHVYLLVNVLMLGFTIVLYCEGKLPRHTPNWLMMGYLISITGSFMFLLLSIWMAMQAAVAAQSYEARLLTQLVRLPVPSWEEIEACRTYASEFEQTEPRQMFRVPFAFGRQENLVPQQQASGQGSAPAAQSRLLQGDVDMGSDVSSEPGEGLASSTATDTPSRAGTATSTRTQAAKEEHTDPWGLERRGDGIYELGCKQGHEIARLRHILLARHAMTYWQTLDAFARVSMSIGVNQLLLAMCYYLIGYIMVEVGCSTSAAYGVILLTAMAETLTRLDMSLSPAQMRFLQILLLVGPLTSCAAGYHWTRQSLESSQTAEALIVLAFFSHSMYLALMTHFSRIRPQDNGAMLPTAFRSILYLDVFGWLKMPRDDEFEEDFASVSGFRSGGGTPLEPGTGTSLRPGFYATAYPGVPGGDSSPEAAAEQEAASRSGPAPRPALAAVKYSSGKPVPTRPEDAAPANAAQDMRGLPEAPQPHRRVSEADETEFYRAASWLEGKEGDSPLGSGWAGPVETGHEKEPGIVPWLVFSTAMRALCLAWFCSAAYHSLGASHIWRFDGPPDLLATFTSSSLLQTSTGPEALQVSWPFLDLEPRSLACDASGTHFAVTDGFALYTASLALPNSSEAPSLRRSLQAPKLGFAEFPCPALAGEGLQDVALACNGSCAALLLHEQGRKLSACNAGGPSLDITTAWLEHLRVDPEEDLAGAHGQVEKPVSLALDPNCGDGDFLGPCTVLGTTRGRAVRMHLHGQKLAPAVALRDRADIREAPLKQGQVRVLGGRQLAVLAPGGQSIQVTGPGGSTQEVVPVPNGPAAAFCAGGGYLHLLGPGPNPRIWRVEMPAFLAQSQVQRS